MVKVVALQRGYYRGEIREPGVLGAVLIEDGRTLYNHQLVIPVTGLPEDEDE